MSDNLQKIAKNIQQAAATFQHTANEITTIIAEVSEVKKQTEALTHDMQHLKVEVKEAKENVHLTKVEVDLLLSAIRNETDKIIDGNGKLFQKIRTDFFEYYETFGEKPTENLSFNLRYLYKDCRRYVNTQIGEPYNDRSFSYHKQKDYDLMYTKILEYMELYLKPQYKKFLQESPLDQLKLDKDDDFTQTTLF